MKVLIEKEIFENAELEGEKRVDMGGARGTPGRTGSQGRGRLKEQQDRCGWNRMSKGERDTRPDQNVRVRGDGGDLECVSKM